MALATIAALIASSVVFAPPTSAQDVIVDSSAGRVFGVSLALDAAGNPVVAYDSGEPSEGPIVLLHCDDPNCEGIETSTGPAVTAWDGLNPSLALDAGGNPVIAYSGFKEVPTPSGGFSIYVLEVLHCDDPNCEGTETPTRPHEFGADVVDVSLVLDAVGNPVIAYHESDGLVLLHCDDPNCEGVETPVVVDPGSAEEPSLALDAAGNPVIAYFARDFGADLKVVHCDDPNCEGTETPVRLDTPDFVGRYPSLLLDAAGNPVVAYLDGTNGDLRVLHCDDPKCQGTEAPTSPDTAGRVGLQPSLALDGAGNPVIAYGAGTNDDMHLKVLHCDDPNCEGTESPTSPDTRHVGRSASLALDATGNPIVAYLGNAPYFEEGVANLKILHCDDPHCAPPRCGGKAVTIDLAAGASGIGTAGNDVILGTQGDDVIEGLGGDDLVCGKGGNDTITGGEGDDTLYGGPGNDRIRANQGNDTVVGGPGNDYLYGGIGADIITGAGGDDTIGGFGGADTIDAGAGRDIVFGGFGADTITGGPGDDAIFGLVGNDIIDGGDGDDIVNGDRGSDTLNGDLGNDVLNGGNGPDIISGGPGDDQLNGGKANDVLNGQDGQDTCAGNKGLDIGIACEIVFGIP